MKNNDIKMLDCTLRDGGYVNKWKFGSDAINKIIEGLIDVGIEHIEIGFLRDTDYQEDNSVFTYCKDIRNIIEPYAGKAKFAAMIEAKEDVSKQFPLDKIEQLKESGLHMIRIMQWEWLMEKHLDYCRKVKDKGVEITVQPTAVVDYNDDRFKELIKYVNEIHPYSFYIVDTWGTESPDKVMHWAELADKYLDEEICLGYHGHNNKMQGLACLDRLISMGLSRELLCDVSIGGMGKGPGNLQTEVVADYLNERYGRTYSSDKICELYANYIDEFYQDEPWGYSLYHFIGSKYFITQNFATYFKKMNYGVDTFLTFVKSLRGREKVVFTQEFTENRLKELGLK